MYMYIKNIVLVSFLAELSNLSSIWMFIKGKILTRLFFLIIFMYHLHRYFKYYDKVIILTKKYINLWYINLIDYFIILLYQLYLYKSDNILLLFLFSIFSGLLAFLFIYLENSKKKFTNNIYQDLFIVISLIIVYFYEKNNQIRFFVIRDLISHILKFIYLY
jgi:hypothetical protein